jgi:hypothetical protein
VLRNLNDLLCCLQLARGFALITSGRHAEAVDALLRVFDPADPTFHQRERFSGVMFLAEAAVRAGRPGEARAVLAGLEQVAATTPAPLLHTQLSYARAVLASDAEAEKQFTTALQADLTRWPWIRARLELAYGSWLRRQRRVAESRLPRRCPRRRCRSPGWPPRACPTGRSGSGSSCRRGRSARTCTGSSPSSASPPGPSSRPGWAARFSRLTGAGRRAGRAAWRRMQYRRS